MRDRERKRVEEEVEVEVEAVGGDIIHLLSRIIHFDKLENKARQWSD